MSSDINSFLYPLLGPQQPTGKHKLHSTTTLIISVIITFLLTFIITSILTSFMLTYCVMAKKCYNRENTQDSPNYNTENMSNENRASERYYYIDIHPTTQNQLNDKQDKEQRAITRINNRNTKTADMSMNNNYYLDILPPAQLDVQDAVEQNDHTRTSNPCREITVDTHVYI